MFNNCSYFHINKNPPPNIKLRIRFKLLKMWASKPVNFYKNKLNAKGSSLAPDTFLYKELGKFGFPNFHVFATDSCTKTSMLIKFDMINQALRFIFLA